MVAEFETDLISQRTIEGLAIARAKGRLRGKPLKLSPKRAARLLEDHDSGTYTSAELAELYEISRATVYRTVRRQQRGCCGSHYGCVDGVGDRGVVPMPIQRASVFPSPPCSGGARDQRARILKIQRKGGGEQS